MLLKYIYLYLNVDEYPNKIGSEFDFRNRYICNFLERRLRLLKFKTEGFNKICVQGRHIPEEACPIRGENAAVPSVAFDQIRYESLGLEEHHEFFIGMLCEGFEKCARFHKIPFVELMDAIEDFRRGGYKNEWTQKTKFLRPSGLRASLCCSLDTERFVLTLQLEEQKKGVIFKEVALETKPDEIIFGWRFKDVVQEDEIIVVKDNFGKPTFSLPLVKIEKQ